LTPSFAERIVARVKPESFEPGTRQIVRFARVKNYAEQKPFIPFRIVTRSGRAYDVPTADHIGFLGLLRRIEVIHDDFSSTGIHALHVSTIEPLRRSRRKRAA
jgi:hypothetical protein